MIGVLIVLVGGFAGWYFFRSGVKLPGMQIGTQNVSPAPTGISENDVTSTTGSAVVTYTDSGYVPARVTVKKGTVVMFKNESNSAMWTASGVHPTHKLLPGFDELTSVEKSGAYEYTFVKVGTWQYHNHMKPSDVGYVVVTE